MPWRESTFVSERSEFIHWARQPGRNFSAVCARFGISRKTGYKWDRRATAGGEDALLDRPPATRYTPSERVFPAVLPPIAYAPGDVVRTVHDRGRVKFRGWLLRVSHAFIGPPVALRAVDDGVWDVYFCHQRIGRADLREPPVEA